MWVEIALVVVLVLVNAGLSGSEMAFVSLRESQVNRLAEEEGERGRKLAALVQDPNRFLSTIQIGITLAGFLASATAAVSLAEPLFAPLAFLGDFAEPAAIFAVTVLLSYVTLVLGELAPKRIAMQRAQGWALRAAGPITVVARLTHPIVWLLGKSTEGVVRLGGFDPHAAREEVTEEEIKDMLAAQESMPEEQRSIIAGALELDDRRLWQILVPRSEVLFLPAGLDAAGGRERLIEAGLSRAPVTGTTEDDVVGVVHIRSLVDAVGRVGDFIRPAIVLPDSVGVLQALGRMQKERGQLALVVDEFGSIAGIVTLEDLLEEIVGEIYDEYDRDTAAVVHHEDGSMEMPGSFPAHDLDDLGVTIDPGPARDDRRHRARGARRDPGGRPDRADRARGSPSSSRSPTARSSACGSSGCRATTSRRTTRPRRPRPRPTRTCDLRPGARARRRAHRRGPDRPGGRRPADDRDADRGVLAAAAERRRRHRAARPTAACPPAVISRWCTSARWNSQASRSRRGSRPVSATTRPSR